MFVRIKHILQIYVYQQSFTAFKALSRTLGNRDIYTEISINLNHDIFRILVKKAFIWGLKPPPDPNRGLKLY